MKKILVTSIVLIFILLLCACSKSSPNTTTGSITEAKATTEGSITTTVQKITTTASVTSTAPEPLEYNDEIYGNLISSIYGNNEGFEISIAESELELVSARYKKSRNYKSFNDGLSDNSSMQIRILKESDIYKTDSDKYSYIVYSIPSTNSYFEIFSINVKISDDGKTLTVDSALRNTDRLLSTPALSSWAWVMIKLNSSLIEDVENIEYEGSLRHGYEDNEYGNILKNSIGYHKGKMLSTEGKYTSLLSIEYALLDKPITEFSSENSPYIATMPIENVYFIPNVPQGTCIIIQKEFEELPQNIHDINISLSEDGKTVTVTEELGEKSETTTSGYGLYIIVLYKTGVEGIIFN